MTYTATSSNAVSSQDMANAVLKVSESLTNDIAPDFTENAPSLASSAQVADLSISEWRGRKLAKKQSEEVTQRANADDHTARVIKNLLPDCPELEAVHKMSRAIREYHVSSTMPWGKLGSRLLPTKFYMNYHQNMTAMIADWQDKVEKFKVAYSWSMSEAESSLGDLHDPSDYPTVDELHTKFSISLEYSPLTDVDDFRLSIPAEALEQAKEDYNKFYTARFETAMRDVWQRVYTALQAASEKLDYSDDGEKTVFRNSLVGNITSLFEVLDMCNVTNDTQMSAVRQQLLQTFDGVTAEALREDEYLRRETKTNVDAIIAQLPSIDM